jgi:hypothetical protein
MLQLDWGELLFAGRVGSIADLGWLCGMKEAVTREKKSDLTTVEMCFLEDNPGKGRKLVAVSEESMKYSLLETPEKQFP